MLWILATAVAALSAAIAVQDRAHRKDLHLKDAELAKCLEDRTRAETAFRAEISALFREVQTFREDIYRQSQSQQRALKKLIK